jgi:hypothetical protein
MLRGLFQHRRKSHSEDLHDLYSASNVIRMLTAMLIHYIRDIKLSIRWAGHLACMERMTNAYTVLVSKPEGKEILGDLDVDEEIV